MLTDFLCYYLSYFLRNYGALLGLGFFVVSPLTRIWYKSSACNLLSLLDPFDMNE